MKSGAFLKVKEGRVGFRTVTHSVFTFASKFFLCQNHGNKGIQSKIYIYDEYNRRS